jgi:predicted oxidoreductase
MLSGVQPGDERAAMSWFDDQMDADAIVIGAGLAGLTATAELIRAGRSVLLLDQEPESNLGGQAFCSFGGLFLVGSPEQRRMGIKDSRELAWQDWLGSAFFDRGTDDPAGEDYWAYQWAEAYVDFAAGEKRSWLHGLGIRWLPLVGWAERGGYLADGHGNSVPRFHITWGTGPAVLAPFERQMRHAAGLGLVTLRFRHRVDELTVTGGAVDGVRGAILEPSQAPRGTRSSRRVTGEFELHAPVVIVTSGGIGGNLELIRENWPERLGPVPRRMIRGVPEYVDGRMLAIAERAGGRVVNRDRMWHYTEGIQNWDPVWAGHGIRILPGPSSLWFDARGRRFPPPHFPGFDTLGTLAAIGATGYDYSWFVLTQKIIEKEFALSGSEQNPDLTGKDLKLTLSRVRPGATPPVEAFKRHGADFVVAGTLPELVDGMNKLTKEPLIDLAEVERQIVARDRELDNSFTKDMQVMAIRNARHSRGERLARTAAPHKILDPKAGPLIAVRLSVLTRKTLGGLQTDLSGRVLRAVPGGPPAPVPGLYAAGEVAGFGGGGMHGYRSLEGSFLGGCLFSGRQAGRAAARETGALPGFPVGPTFWWRMRGCPVSLALDRPLGRSAICLALGGWRRESPGSPARWGGLLVAPVRLAGGRRCLYVSDEPVVDQRHHQGQERGDQRARDDRAQPVGQRVRQRREDQPEDDAHHQHDDEDQDQGAEHVPAVAADELLAAPERREHARTLDDDDRHDHRPDGDQPQAGHDEQEQPDGDRDAGQDRGADDRPEVRHGRPHGVADGHVGAAVAHVLHGLDQRRLQQVGRHDLHQGAEYGPDGGAAQAEERGDDRRGQVDDERDREEVAGKRLVHLPRFAENA